MNHDRSLDNPRAGRVDVPTSVGSPVRFPGSADRRNSGLIGVMVVVAVVLMWRLCRVALCALLMLMEPVVRIVLVPIAYMSFLVTLIFGFMIGDARFPKWGMLAFSVGALCLYWLFLGLLALLVGGFRGRD